MVLLEIQSRSTIYNSSFCTSISNGQKLAANDWSQAVAETELKILWQTAFTARSTEFFDAIWGNAELRTSLFGVVNEFNLGAKSSNKIIFDSWVSSQDNILFKFIKVE